MMSDVMPQHDLPTAARAGADLRAARERLGWDLAAIAAGLRIRQPYLEALEDGRIDLLPGPAYALGFLRTYAAALGLEPDEIARRFKAEAGDVNAKTELTFPAPMPERGIPAGAVVLLGLVLAVGAYAGWYHLSGEGRLPAETRAIPERLAPLAQQALPPVPATPAAPTRLAAATPPDAADPPPTSAAAAEPVPPTASVSPSSAAAASITPPSGGDAGISASAAPADTGVTGATGNDPTAVAANVPVAAPDAAASATPDGADHAPQLMLRASADAWVQVRNKAGHVLLNRILHAGDTWAVPDQPNLLLTTGNAGGTELVVNGVSTGVLGNSGVVRRDLPLNVASIQQDQPPSASGSHAQRASLRTPQ